MLPVPGRLSALKGSPMFQLSLSSKELFHSNFLAYLFEREPPLIGSVLGIPPKTATPVVLREKDHIDIQIIAGTRIAIENKVKSVAEEKQLVDILQRTRNKPFDHYILMSLLGNNLSLIPCSGWREIGYSRIIGALRAYSFANPYLKLLVDDYCDFTEILIYEMGSALVKQEYSFFRTGNPNMGQWVDLKLHDVLMKYGMSLFKNYIMYAFPAIQVGIQINHAKPTITCSKPGKNPDKYVQIEDIQYRKAVLGTQSQLPQYFANGWFNQGYKSPTGKNLLSYSADDGSSFWYQIDPSILPANQSFSSLAAQIDRDL